MGNRNDIDELSTTNASVLLSILKLIDKYDLYGQVAMPKHHKQSDVPEIYRLAAKTKVKKCLNVYFSPLCIIQLSLSVPILYIIHRKLNLDLLLSIYLIFQGVFINPAFIEPFGLTLIEVLNYHFSLFSDLFFFMVSNYIIRSVSNRRELMVCPLLQQ